MKIRVAQYVKSWGNHVMIQAVLSGVVSEDAPGACVAQKKGTGALTEAPPACVALK